MHNKLTIRKIIESGLPVLIVVIFVFWNYAFIFKVPYLGFDFNPTDGKVNYVWEEQPVIQSLQPGDRLLRVATDFHHIGDNRISLLNAKPEIK
jgi:hypothetical protein